MARNRTRHQLMVRNPLRRPLLVSLRLSLSGLLICGPGLPDYDGSRRATVGQSHQDIPIVGCVEKNTVISGAIPAQP